MIDRDQIHLREIQRLDQALAEARAEIAEVTAALDAALQSDIGNEKLITVMRRRYGREARQWEANHEQRKHERDEARAEIERMRPVYEAAVRYYREMDFHASRVLGEIFTCESALLNAIDAAKEQSNG